MVNVLVFDWDRSIGTLVRSALRAAECRVSVESNPQRAKGKLDTALFDALVIGPAGLPLDLAEHVEEEWPALPIVLVGVEREVPSTGPVVAVLARPLSVERLAGVARRLARAAQDSGVSYDMPIDLIAGSQRLACRVVRVARSSVMLEPDGGAGAVEGPLALCRGKVRVAGEVAFRDGALLAVRVAPDAFEELAEGLEVADEQGHGGPAGGRGVPRL